MQLYFNPASPYVRKVRVTAHELGLGGRIELISVSLTPVSPHDAVRSSNPIGKIPALITDDGAALYDSPVICEYLEALAGGNRIFPAPGAARWTALRRQALADGVMDAAVLTRYEQAVRPQELRWQSWVEGQLLKIRTALDALERENLEDALDIGTISIACALGYLDLRFASESWRTGRPRLAAWIAAVGKRPSLVATAPAAP
ncbi:MAG TPA: glutathione S-transferase [Steroidobacteraceae bacterium]|nr:glutathione S-transferase [Steroidobacteraceae bacterium]